VATTNQDDWFRCQALIDAGVDIICLDTDDGVTDVTIDFIKKLKDESTGHMEVLAGLVSSVRQARELLEAGVDGLRIGSSGCGGAADAKTVYEITKLARGSYGIPCCAEGVRDAPQMIKALCMGASSVTMTDLLSKCAEAPGDHYYRDGVRVKLQPANEVVGNALLGAGMGVTGGAAVKKAVSGATVDRGSAKELLPHLGRQVQKSFRDLCQPTISHIHVALFSGNLRMERQYTQQPQTTMEQHPRTMRMTSSGLHNRW
jgi:IMP dehydrogenase